MKIDSPGSALKAINVLNNLEIDGQHLVVKVGKKDQELIDGVHHVC